MNKTFLLPVVASFSVLPGDQIVVIRGICQGVATRTVGCDNWASTPSHSQLLAALTAAERPRLQELCAWLGYTSADHERINAWLNYLNAKGFLEPTPTSWHLRYPIWTATNALRAAAGKG